MKSTIISDSFLRSYSVSRTLKMHEINRNKMKIQFIRQLRKKQIEKQIKDKQSQSKEQNYYIKIKGKQPSFIQQTYQNKQENKQKNQQKQQNKQSQSYQLYINCLRQSEQKSEISFSLQPMIVNDNKMTKQNVFERYNKGSNLILQQFNKTNPSKLLFNENKLYQNQQERRSYQKRKKTLLSLSEIKFLQNKASKQNYFNNQTIYVKQHKKQYSPSKSLKNSRLSLYSINKAIQTSPASFRFGKLKSFQKGFIKQIKKTQQTQYNQISHQENKNVLNNEFIKKKYIKEHKMLNIQIVSKISLQQQSKQPKVKESRQVQQCLQVNQPKLIEQLSYPKQIKQTKQTKQIEQIKQTKQANQIQLKTQEKEVKNRRTKKRLHQRYVSMDDYPSMNNKAQTLELMRNIDSQKAEIQKNLIYSFKQKKFPQNPNHLNQMFTTINHKFLYKKYHINTSQIDNLDIIAQHIQLKKNGMQDKICKIGKTKMFLNS